MKTIVKGLAYDKCSVNDSYGDKEEGGRRNKEGVGWGEKRGGERPQKGNRREGPGTQEVLNNVDAHCVLLFGLCSSSLLSFSRRRRRPVPVDPVPQVIFQPRLSQDRTPSPPSAPIPQERTPPINLGASLSLHASAVADDPQGQGPRNCTSFSEAQPGGRGVSSSLGLTCTPLCSQ